VRRYQLSVTPEQVAVRPERQDRVEDRAAVVFALIDADHEHDASAARGR
jgi:hypothetical protein